MTDYDDRRPDWGNLDIDFSMFPPEFMRAYRTGVELQLRWVETVARRTREYAAKLPD